MAIGKWQVFVWFQVFYRVGGAAATDAAGGVRPEITAVGALPLASAGTIAVVSQMKPAGGEPWINPQPFPGVTSERKRPRKQQLTELMDATDRPNTSDKRAGGSGSGGSGSALSSGGRPSVIPIRSAKAKKSSAVSKAGGSSPPAPAIEVEQEKMDVSVAPHEGLAAVEAAPPTVKEANNGGQVNGGQSTGPVRRRRPRLTVNDEARRASASHHNLLPEDAEMVNNLERAAAEEIGRRCPVKDSVLQTRKLLTAFYDNSTTEPDLLSVVGRLFQLLTEHVRNGAQEFSSVYLSAVMTLMNKLVITSDHGNDMVVMLDAIDRLLDSLVTDYNPYNGPVKMSGPDALDHDGAVNGAANRGRC